MMMMSRTQPLEGGERGGVCGEGRLRVVRGRGLGGKRSERAGAQAGHGGRGPRRGFLPLPGHAAREAAGGRQDPRGIDDSAGGHGHLGEGQRKGRRSTDLMDGLRGGCGRGAPVFGAVLAAMQDWQELRCSHLPRRPPFHIQQRRRGQPLRRFFTSLVVSSREWPALGGKGDRDHEDSDGEYPPSYFPTLLTHRTDLGPTSASPEYSHEHSAEMNNQMTSCEIWRREGNGEHASAASVVSVATFVGLIAAGGLINILGLQCPAKKPSALATLTLFSVVRWEPGPRDMQGQIPISETAGPKRKHI
nr:uncharacterized protein LOC741253 isoform X3 [Pan troglodytes]